MFFIIEIILEFLAEILLTLLFELGFRRVNDVFKHPVVVATLFGVVSGFVSLLFVQDVLIRNIYLQLAALLIIPIVLGLIMREIGRMHRRWGGIDSNLDTFLAGFSFAMAMSIVRFLFG